MINRVKTSALACLLGVVVSGCFSNQQFLVSVDKPVENGQHIRDRYRIEFETLKQGSHGRHRMIDMNVLKMLQSLGADFYKEDAAKTIRLSCVNISTEDDQHLVWDTFGLLTLGLVPSADTTDITREVTVTISAGNEILTQSTNTMHVYKQGCSSAFLPTCILWGKRSADNELYNGSVARVAGTFNGIIWNDDTTEMAVCYSSIIRSAIVKYEKSKRK